MLLQLRITLKYIEPPIWRELLIDSERHLEDLHWAIQIAFGWDDAHLYQFHKDGKRYEIEQDGNEFEMSSAEDASDMQIKTMLSKRGDHLVYEYDFGDSWMHEVVVLSADQEIGMYEPLLTGGERNCPPEDCGGPPGYAMLLEAMADKKHPERQRLIEWMGYAYDPEDFDPSLVNMEMRENFKD